MLFFLVTPCFVVAVQSCMGWIPIKKKKNQQKAITNFEPFECIELFVPWQVVYKHSDNSFTIKPASLNFVPQWIHKIYHAGTTWFYRFALVIVAQAHISLMTRLNKRILHLISDGTTSHYISLLCLWQKDDKFHHY